MSDNFRDPLTVLREMSKAQGMVYIGSLSEGGRERQNALLAGCRTLDAVEGVAKDREAEPYELRAEWRRFYR